MHVEYLLKEHFMEITEADKIYTVGHIELNRRCAC